jgi:hypothetical protein
MVEDGDLRHMRGHAAASHNPFMLNTLLVIHVAGGSVALASMLIPLFTKKGGSIHRKAGWVFVAGMTAVSLTAFILAGVRALTDPSAQGRQAGVFLFYIALLTGAGVSAGIRVLRAKQRTAAHGHWWDITVAAALAAGALLTLGYGLATGHALSAAFSLIGIVNGTSQLRYWLSPPSHHMHWWFEHMSAMLGACIAATTAFLVLNADRLGVETLSLALWLSPSVIGVPTIALWTRYYRQKFGAGRQAHTVANLAGQLQ